MAAKSTRKSASAPKTTGCDRQARRSRRTSAGAKAGATRSRSRTARKSPAARATDKREAVREVIDRQNAEAAKAFAVSAPPKRSETRRKPAPRRTKAPAPKSRPKPAQSTALGSVNFRNFAVAVATVGMIFFGSLTGAQLVFGAAFDYSEPVEPQGPPMLRADPAFRDLSTHRGAEEPSASAAPAPILSEKELARAEVAAWAGDTLAQALAAADRSLDRLADAGGANRHDLIAGRFERVLSASRERIEHLYNMLQEEYPHARGLMEIYLEIEPKGNVSFARIENSTFGREHTRFQVSVLREIVRAHFPTTGSSEIVRLIVPLRFRSKTEALPVVKTEYRPVAAEPKWEQLAWDASDPNWEEEEITF